MSRASRGSARTVSRRATRAAVIPSRYILRTSPWRALTVAFSQPVTSACARSRSPASVRSTLSPCRPHVLDEVTRLIPSVDIRRVIGGRLGRPIPLRRLETLRHEGIHGVARDRFHHVARVLALNPERLLVLPPEPRRAVQPSILAAQGLIGDIEEERARSLHTLRLRLDVDEFRAGPRALGEPQAVLDLLGGEPIGSRRQGSVGVGFFDGFGLGVFGEERGGIEGW